MIDFCAECRAYKHTSHSLLLDLNLSFTLLIPTHTLSFLLFFPFSLLNLILKWRLKEFSWVWEILFWISPLLLMMNSYRSKSSFPVNMISEKFLSRFFVLWSNLIVFSLRNSMEMIELILYLNNVTLILYILLF